MKLYKKWLKAHGYHDDDVSFGYVYNNYGIELTGKRPISGWFLFITDTEITDNNTVYKEAVKRLEHVKEKMKEG